MSTPFPPEVSKALLRVVASPGGASALDEDVKNGVTQADLYRLYAKTPKNGEPLEAVRIPSQSEGTSYPEVRYANAGLVVEVEEEKKESAVGHKFGGDDIPVADWIKKLPPNTVITTGVPGIPKPLVDPYNAPWEDGHGPRQILQEVDQRIRAATQEIYNTMRAEIRVANLESEVSVTRTTEVRIVDTDEPVKRHRELLMHRILRFREMFEIYWPERDAEYPIKTFGVEVINADPTKIMHAWYLKDPANKLQDIAFYHRAAKRFEGEVSGDTVPPMETWSSCDYKWARLALRCMQLDLSDYEMIKTSIVRFDNYHEDNYPLYNPDYVMPGYGSDEEDEDEPYPRPVIRAPVEQEVNNPAPAA